MANRVQVNPETIRRAIRSGVLETITNLGGQAGHRSTEAQFQAWLARRKAQANPDGDAA